MWLDNDILPGGSAFAYTNCSASIPWFFPESAAGAQSVLIKGSVIQGNRTTDPNGKGGGIYAPGSPSALLVVEDCTLSGNNSAFGGGLWTWTLTEVRGGEISGNHATKEGGGVYAGGADLKLIDFMYMLNGTPQTGKTKFFDNRAPAGKGDGIAWIKNQGGTLTNNADMGNNKTDLLDPP